MMPLRSGLADSRSVFESDLLVLSLESQLLLVAPSVVWHDAIILTKVLGMPNPPHLSPEQRMAALEKAALVRTQRAEIKAELKKGSVSFAALLERAGNEDLIGKMKVINVLENLPGFGKVKAQKVMEQVGISDTRRLAGLGANQKNQLLSIVG